MRSVQSIRCLVAPLSLLGFLLFGTTHAQTLNPDPAPEVSSLGGFVDGIAAIVDKDVITLRELRLRTEQIREELLKQNIQLPQDTVLQRQVLQRLIQERLEDQEARRQGIRVDDAVVMQAVNTIAERNHISIEQMRSQIEADSTWTEYLRDIRREILHDRLRERTIDHTITITDQEVDAFLKEQGAQRGIGAAAGRFSPETGGQPAVLALAQILVRVPENSSPDQVAALRRKADDLLARVRRGEDFSAVAAASSDGPEALEGGMMGARPVDGWPDLFLNAVGALPPGQVSDLIQSGNGFHILKVVGRQDAPSAHAATSFGADSVATPQGPVHITQTHAGHILIKTSAVMSDEQARQRLTQLRQRIVQGGEDFADMARRFSADASAPQGGDLGWINPGVTVPAFEAAMNSLAPGEVSEPVQSPFGWHLIKVQARRVQDMADEIQYMHARQTLFERRAQLAFENWLEQLRDQAYIDNRLEKREQLEQAL